MPESRTLAETIALLEATLESTHEGIAVVDLNHRIIVHNSRFLEMFGITAEQARRETTDALLRGILPQIEDEQALVDRTGELWAKPERPLFDILRFKDGRVFEYYIAPHRIDSKLVGLVGSFRDVSERWRAEQALEYHRAFLEKAQEVAHIGSWVADLQAGDRLGWSHEAHRIFGVPLGEFDGTTRTFLSMVHAEDRELVRAASMAAQQGDAAYDIEHRIIRADGTVRWVHEQADVVRDARGRPLRMIGTVQDVTERRLLEEQLRQSQKMEAIGRLAGGIAHDLNNALTAIAGYAELAIGQFTDEHPARPDVIEIRRAAERAGSVTRQLLAFSRKQLLAPRVFSLNDTVASIGRLLSRLLGSDIAVQTRIGPAPPVLGDPGQIEQAIINLAVNARDAMPAGGRLTLETSVVDADEALARSRAPMLPGRYVRLRVSDTGHGMPPETQSRIFEPFFTTKEVGKGTGLGLSMVYGTLKQIGGYIFVDSEVGKGTTFSLYFPPAPVRMTAESRPTPEEGRKPRTVLVVEDETAVRNLVASALRTEGYHLLVADSAEQAMQIVDSFEGTIDLVLTDALMPGTSGVDLARALTARTPGLPVILMTGYAIDVSEGGEGSGITVMPKPFTPRELRQRVKTILDRE